MIKAKEKLRLKCSKKSYAKQEELNKLLELLSKILDHLKPLKRIFNGNY